MLQKRYVEQIVDAWEDSYKKGLLTFWILTALYESSKHVGEIKLFIEKTARTNLTVDEKSLYRSLTRFKKLELVDSTDRPSINGGPALKIYTLTQTGNEAYALFFQRNIQDVFLTDSFNKLMKGLRDE